MVVLGPFLVKIDDKVGLKMSTLGHCQKLMERIDAYSNSPQGRFESSMRDYERQREEARQYEIPLSYGHADHDLVDDDPQPTSYYYYNSWPPGKGWVIPNWSYSNPGASSSSSSTSSTSGHTDAEVFGTNGFTSRPSSKSSGGCLIM
jgi:hypothetical protein